MLFKVRKSETEAIFFVVEKRKVSFLKTRERNLGAKKIADKRKKYKYNKSENETIPSLLPSSNLIPCPIPGNGRVTRREDPDVGRVFEKITQAPESCCEAPMILNNTAMPNLSAKTEFRKSRFVQFVDTRWG
ncbi:MAG: hypothetical protein Q8P67_03815 [archaeon]|nr:hypothetical protein [archaeon]